MAHLPVPSNESERLNSLRELGIMQAAAEERYDRITRIASRLLDAPIALVSIVDERHQWLNRRRA